MKNIHAIRILSFTVTMGAALTASSAWATEQSQMSRLTLKAPTARLADNVVVTPSGGTGAPQAAPPQAAPVQTAPATQQTAVVESPKHTNVVHAEVDAPHNYMSTIAISALMGGLVGVLVGGSIYYLGDQTHARNIGYWGAGGVLLGVGVGVVQVAVQENRLSNATALNKLPTDPAPTFRLALLNTTF